MQPQPLALQIDIKHYRNSLRRIKYIYNQYWTVDMGESEHEYKYWIINDIITFANAYQGTVYGYVAQFYTIFYRNLRLKTPHEIGVFLNRMSHLPPDTQIHILWGLLLPEERERLILIFPDGPILLEEEF
jgi:hypothetical protein